MLIDGTSNAVKHTHIKRQLRTVLIALGTPQVSRTLSHPLSFARWRTFTTDQVPASSEESHDTSGDNVASRRSSTKFRHIYPNGRIVGKPGGRQRTSSRTLAINALGKPRNVIVLRDVNEPQEEEGGDQDPVLDEKTNHTTELTPDKQGKLPKRAGKPPSSDVFESIEELRPEESFLDEADLLTLSRQLATSYTQPQLKGYLRRKLSRSQPHKQEKDLSDGFASSIWRAGSSAIDKRLPLTDKQATQGSKDAIIGQILRNVWLLSVQSEERVIGEQELVLPAQHIARLCAESPDGQRIPAWQTLLSSPLLARSVQLHALSDAGVMRLVGRQEDTDQVISELRSRLASMPMLVLEREALRELSRRSLDPLNALLSPPVLDEIQKRTLTSVASLDDGTIAVSGFKSRQCQHARAMIYDLLGIEDIETHRSLLDLSASKDLTRTAPMPLFYAGPGDTLATSRYNRYSVPLRKAKTTNAIARDRVDDTFPQRLQTLISATDRSVDNTYRRANADTKPQEAAAKQPSKRISDRWDARIGLLLYKDVAAGTRSAAKSAIFSPQSPFSDGLLDLFIPLRQTPSKHIKDAVPADNTQKSYHSRTLVAHLYPLLTTSAKSLPKLELRFAAVHNSVNGISQPSFVFDRMEAKLEQHQIQIQLSDKCADLQLCKDVYFDANHLRFIVHDTASARILDNLTTAIGTQDASVQLASLQDLIPSEPLRVRLPSFKIDDTTKDGSASQWYTFSHFEIRDKLRYRPSPRMAGAGPATQLAGWREGVSLSIVESDAGAVGGRRRDLIVHRPFQSRKDAVVGSEEPFAAQLSQAEDVFRSALCLVNAMTIASRE